MVAAAVVLMCVALTAGRTQETGEAKGNLLKLLGIEPSAESIDYVQTKTQFQLHTLLTEQRHQKTWYLGERIQKDTVAGLRMLSSVDDDIRAKMDELAAAPEALEQAARAVEPAILGRQEDLRLRLRRDGPAGQTDGERVLAPVLARVKADEDIWRKVAGRHPGRGGYRGQLDRRDDRGGPGPHQLPRGLRGPPAHRAAPAPGPGHRQGRRRHLRHRGRRDVVGHRDGPGGARRVEGGAGLRSRREPQEPLFRLQQSGRPAAAVRPEPKRARRARHHQDQPDDGAPGHHRIDADAGDDDRDLCRRDGHRDGRRAGPAEERSRRRKWPGSDSGPGARARGRRRRGSRRSSANSAACWTALGRRCRRWRR